MTPPKLSRRALIYIIAGGALLMLWLFSGAEDQTPPSPAPIQGTAASQEAFLSALRSAIEARDDKRLKAIVNALLAPPQYRLPEVPVVNSLTDAEALSMKVGMYQGDPGFKLFLKVYREAPTMSRERRGYPEIPEYPAPVPSPGPNP